MKSLVWFSAEEVQASHITQPMLVSMVKGFLKTPEPELVSQATSLLAISVFLSWCNTKHLGSYTMLFCIRYFQFSMRTAVFAHV